MATDLPASRDLTLIFERDDVREVFAGHCAKTHFLDDPDFMRDCQYCQQMLVVLVTAILEWKALCDLEPEPDMPSHESIADA